MSVKPEPPPSSEGAHQPAAAGDTLGRYRLLKKIARGGMAEVFAARSFGAHGFEKTVAIKRILSRYGGDPQFVRMMVDEAKITVLLNHANVATILELCELDGDYFIVMEFVPGQSLSAVGKKLRDKDERFGVLESCFIVVELLQGLHAAHIQRDQSGRSAHIVHRDVSPQNVLVNFDGHVKVIDFGIARAKHRLELTEVGTIKGKLRYLAPEMIDPGRFMKSGDFDHRVDIFAAGIVLWELVARRTLYQGDDEMAVYDAITDTDAPNLADLGLCDQALAKIIAKALVREPDARYLTGEEFADDLRAYLYRTDPAFTHKRIAGVMERLFPNEKAEMLSLERGSYQGPLVPSVEPSVVAPDPAPSPKPISPNAETQVQSTSDPRARAPIATTQMRGGADSIKTLGGDVKNVVVPVDTGRRRAGPGQGDLLTVMTLVSKSNSAVPVPSSDTVTAGDEAGAKDDRRKLDGSPRGVADDTPHTSERSRSRLANQRLAMRPRLLALAAAAGVGVALLAVVAMELSAPDESHVPLKPRPFVPPLVQLPVRLTVTSPAPGATASIAGDQRAVPATFSVLPGDALAVVVSAPFHAEKIERITVPRDDARDQVLDIALDPDPVALAAKVAPQDAIVEVPSNRAVVKAPPPKREKPRVASNRPATLMIKTKPVWGEVTIDGKKYDETTPLAVSLAPGKHTVVVTHAPKGFQKTFTVTLKPGESETRTVAFE
jgi:serine/threonine protein kinase